MIIIIITIISMHLYYCYYCYYYCYYYYYHYYHRHHRHQHSYSYHFEYYAAADRPPVQWVEMDPQMETLASTCLLQPDWMWAAQLDRSKDTAAQSVAVAGLAALRPTTHTAVSALDHCLQNDQVYPRYAPSQLVWVDLAPLPKVETAFLLFPGVSEFGVPL